MCLVPFLILGLLCAIPSVRKVLPFLMFDYAERDQMDPEYFSSFILFLCSLFAMTVLFLEQIFLILLCYGMRNAKTEFSLKEEFLATFFVFFICGIVSYYFITFPQNTRLIPFSFILAKNVKYLDLQIFRHAVSIFP